MPAPQINAPGFQPSTVTNPGTREQIDQLMADKSFRERYLSDDKTIRDGALNEVQNLHMLSAQRSYFEPSSAASEEAKSKIATMMKDPTFLDRYNHNNPNIRNPAVDELNKLFFAAHGDKPVVDYPGEAPNTPMPTRYGVPQTNRPVPQAFRRTAPPESNRDFGTAMLKDRNPYPGWMQGR